MTMNHSEVFYFFVIVLVSLISRLSEDGKGKIGIVVSTALLVFVASFRDYSVGVDTSGYKIGIEYFHAYGRILWNHAFGIPYGMFASAILDVWDNYSFLLFIEAFITNSLFALRLWDYRGSISISFAMFAYATLVFPLSLCLMCQMMAVSIVFFATRYLDSGKPVTFCLLLLVAALFHTSALVGLIYFALYIASFKSRNRVQWTAKFFGSIALILVGVCAGFQLLGKYGRYSVNESSLGLMVFAQALVFVVAYYFGYRLNNCSNSRNPQNMQIEKIKPSTSYVLGILLSGSSYVVANAGRISYYFMIFGPVFFASIAKESSKSKSGFVLSSILVLWFLFYAWYAYLLHTGLGIEVYTFVWMS